MAALAKYRTYLPATGKINRNHDKKLMKTWILIGKAKVASQYLYTHKKTGETTVNKEVFHDTVPFDRHYKSTTKAGAFMQLEEELTRELGAEAGGE